MTFAVKTRIFETSNTAGVGTLTLLGAQTGHQAVSVVGANNYVTYRLEDGVNWEEGLGQYLAGPDRLTREVIYESSNAGAAVNWGGGTINVVISIPAVGIMQRRRLSLSVAGGAGTTVLTQDQQRNHILEFTGALTGNRVIEVDATVWDWPAVYNNTSGAFTLTFKVTGQTGLEITQGKRRAVHCDGTDIRDSGGDPLASEFAAGTRMLFQQTTAPTGWTKETNATYNDAAFRITTGTVGTGGADAFTTVFGTGKSTSGFTLTISEIPAHAHPADEAAAGANATAGDASGNAAQKSTSSTDNAGGGGSHAHALTSLNLKYADVIIAAKD